MKAHVFLEKFDETLTVREMRAKLRSTGAIGETERPKVVPLTHYLLYKYNVDWHKLVDETRQGSNKEEMEKAEKMLQEVTALFKESEAKASVARQKHNEAQSAENAAKKSEAAAIERESEAKAAAAEAKKTEEQANIDAAAAEAAQQELEAALQELHAQEKAYNDKKAELQKKSEEGGVVSRNKAANELAQLLAEDPLPLRRAKITQEAAVKKAEKATNIAAAAREAATKARQESEAAAASATTARQQAEADATAATAAAKAAAAAKEEADAALESARVQLEAAEAFLAEVRSRPGQAFGALFWLDRELHEQRKYLPVSKGGIAK